MWAIVVVSWSVARIALTLGTNAVTRRLLPLCVTFRRIAGDSVEPASPSTFHRPFEKTKNLSPMPRPRCRLARTEAAVLLVQQEAR